MNDYIRTLSAGALTFIVGAMLGFSIRPNEIKVTIEVTPPMFAVTPEKPPAATAEQIYARLNGPTNGLAKALSREETASNWLAELQWESGDQIIQISNSVKTAFISNSNRLSSEFLLKRYMSLTSTQTIASRPTFEQWCRENYHLTNFMGQTNFNIISNYAPIRR